MADIFVSYASDDRQRVAPLVRALEDEGWSVWWDRELVAGPSYDEKIEDALDAARCVVVAWSAHSIASRWCRAEANEGLEREVLVPLRIDEVRPPLAFRTLQTASLLDWPHRRDGLDALLTGVRDCLGDDRPRINPPGSATTSTSVAVLPFVNMSSDAEQEYFVDGITEDLIDRLAQVKSLKVVARTSSFSFKGRTDDVRTIAKQLGVTHLVEGSVRRAANRVRITAQLVRADDGTHLWSERYDRELQDVFALQDEITVEVADKLTSVLLPSSAQPYRPAPAAYEARLQGRNWLRRLSYGTAKRAVRCFEAAVDADPGFATAHANLAQALFVMHSHSTDHDPVLVQRAADATRRALELDPDLPSAQVLRARMLLQCDYRLQASLDETRRLQTLHPSSHEIGYEHCRVLSYTRAPDALEQAARHLIDIEPFAVDGHFWLAGVLMSREEWAGFDQAVDSIFSIEPGHTLMASQQAVSFAMRGRVGEALAIIETRHMQSWPQAAFVHALAGNWAAVRMVTEKLSDQKGLQVWQAHCHALTGDMTATLRAVKTAVANHDPQLFHLTSGFLPEILVNQEGTSLSAVYDQPDVQEVLAGVDIDRDTVESLRI